MKLDFLETNDEKMVATVSIVLPGGKSPTWAGSIAGSGMHVM